MRQNRHKNTLFKLAILWLVILLLGSFWLSMRSTSDPASMIVLPEVPREGDPLVASFKLNNPTSGPLITQYRLYANGRLLEEGETSLAPYKSKTYRYAYRNHLRIGDQLNFVLQTQSNSGKHEKVVSLPSYPPQILSSFVNLASFSTSVMTSMSTMAYYQSTFGADMGFNIGIIISLVLIALLIFLELPLITNQMRGKILAIQAVLKIKLPTITWILLIIFMAMVYTRVMLAIMGG